MKSVKFLLLISVLTALCADKAAACGWEAYSPKEYYMFRIRDKHNDEASERNLNIAAWAKLTNYDKLSDIEHVVYKMPVDEFHKFYSTKHYDSDNCFLHAIKSMPEICDFLFLAKCNEHIRFKRSSRWYYPGMKVDAPMTLDEIIAKSLSTKGKLLRDRYLLQAVRAMFTLGRYQECIDLWEKEISKLPKSNLMRSMAQEYIAGCELRLGKHQHSLDHFAQLGDIDALMRLSANTTEKLSQIEALELVYKHAPDTRMLFNHFSDIISQVDTYTSMQWGYEASRACRAINDGLDRYQTLALRVASKGKAHNPAAWYYIAAFIADFRGHPAEASRILAKGEAARGSQYEKESIKMLRIYLDAKVHPLNAAYEQRLLAQLRWLDQMIRNNTDNFDHKNLSIAWMHKSGQSFYYWDDMQRRVLLGELCPRLIKAGKTTRAMQLANMADNHLLNVIDSLEVYTFDTATDAYINKTMSLYEYRHDKEQEWNEIDYSNHFFCIIDSLDANAAINYTKRVENPRDALDLFTNAHSYVDSDYLNDLAGTLCLREMRYAEAEKYLSRVSCKYKSNVNEYFNRDAFSFKKKKIGLDLDYKYNFAREMNSLEQAMEQVKDPTRKAKLQYRFAIGLRNSFGYCWALTQYYSGWVYMAECNEQYNINATNAALNRSEQLIEDVLHSAADNDFKAQMQYELCNFKTVATQYPDTHFGRIIHRSCDNLRDYFVKR